MKKLGYCIYCEYFFSKKDAYNREKYLKTSTGKRMLKLILKESLKETKELPNYQDQSLKLILSLRKIVGKNNSKGEQNGSPIKCESQLIKE